MAETLVSPGVLARENDQSFITQQPIQAGAAIVGPTVKGPVELPTLVTSYSDYTNRFGTTFESGSDTYSFFTSLAAENYFNNGGTSLLVTRVVSESSDWTYATSSAIPNNVASSGGSSYILELSSSDELTVESTGSYKGIAINIGTENGGNERYNDFVYVPSGGGTAGSYSTSTSTRTYTVNGVTKQDTTIVYWISVGSQNYDLDDWGPIVSNTINATIPQWVSASYSPVANDGILALTGSSQLSLPQDAENISVVQSNGAYYLYFNSPTSNYTEIGTWQGGSSGTSNAAFVLEAISQGEIFNNSGSILSNNSLNLGTRDNIRWEIATSNTSSGTFSLVVRGGNDNQNAKVVLETWNNLSLDPKSDNYISKVIGDQYYDYDAVENYVKVYGDYPNASRYVRVKSVGYQTPDYFDNTGTAKSQYVDYLPLVGSGSEGGAFGGAVGSIIPSGRVMNMYQNIDSSDSQGLEGTDYAQMLVLLANQDEYSYNLLLVPGLTDATHGAQITTAINNAQQRGDNLVVVDPTAYGASITSVLNEAGGRDTSYAAMYWPWLRTQDQNIGKNVWVPASTLMGGVFAQTDATSAPWFAPAGINRGGIPTAIQAERKLSQANRDTLYEANVNPIASFPNISGPVVYGQKTLQKRASALDRVNVRRLLIQLKSFISQVSQNLVFEQNTIATRTNFLAQVNPYLQSVQQQQGLYAFKVVMDDSNNTPDVIDRNQLIGQIFIQPTKTAEFIILDFNVLPTGATFPQ